MAPSHVGTFHTGIALGVTCCPRAGCLSFANTSLRPGGAQPPFPARRSSDLVEPARARVLRRFQEPRGAAIVAGCPTIAAPRGSRSEEHTPELQSLRHLVCRLPLEKKKKAFR